MLMYTLGIRTAHCNHQYYCICTRRFIYCTVPLVLLRQPGGLVAAAPIALAQLQAMVGVVRGVR